MGVSPSRLPSTGSSPSAASSSPGGVSPSVLPSFGKTEFMIASGECGFDEAMIAGDPCLPGDPYPCPRG